MKHRVPRKIVPSENVYEAVFAKQTSAYADCYRWALTDAQRREWIAAESPVLSGLRVFSCGTFIKASSHRWERSGLAEGILIYCVDGRGCYAQDGREWEVQPGDLLYAPPRSHHSYWADAKTPWTIHWMHLSGELLPHYERVVGLVKRGPVRHIGVHADIIAEFTRLVRMQPMTDEETNWFCVQTIAAGILGRIDALPHNISDIAGAYRSIQKAIALMNTAVDQPFDLERFAREAGCGSRHFTRQFSRVTGMPPGDWFIRQKMQRACALLTLPNIQVKEVANRLSYDDPLYFSRLFKRVMGVPPETYRRKVSNEHGLEGKGR
jgi:AraC-like DNA-binding protein